MAELEFIVTVDESGMVRGIRNVRRESEDLGDDLERSANRGIQAFSRLEKLLAGAFTVSAVKSFITDMINVRGQFQQTEAAYRTMLGSKEAADKLMAESVQLAAVTPFGLKEVTQATKQLIAYGVEAENVTDTIRMLGNVAAGVGSSVGEIAYLYGTLRTQGRAYQNDINQFSSRGIDVYGGLATVMGYAKDEIRGLVEAGKVGFPEIEKMFQNMTAEGGVFYNLMEEQSKTLTGQIANLEDAWDSMLNKLGERTQGVTGAAITGLTDLVENYEKVLEIITALIAVYGSYRTALLVTIALERLAVLQRVGVTASFTLQYTQLVLLQKAQSAYNAVLAASPVLAYTALIAALGTAIYSLYQITDAAEEAQNALNKAHEAGEKAANKDRRAIEQQIEVLNSSKASAEQKAAAYQKIQDLTNGVVKGYAAEEIAAGKAQETITKYVESVRKAIQAREAFSEFNRLSDEIDELNSKGVDALSWSQKLGRSLANTFAPTSQGLTAGEWWEGLFNGDVANKTIVNQIRNAKKTAQAELKKQFGDNWDELITGVPSAQTPTPAARPRTLDVIDAEIKKLKELQNANASNRIEYEKYQKQINALEAERARITGVQTKLTKDQISDRKRFLLDLSKVEDEVNRKSLTQTEEKIQAERDRFSELRRMAKELGLGEDVLNRIDKAEGKAVGSEQYKAETDMLTKQLDAQKKMWEDYESFRTATSESEAKKRYDIDLGYEDKLQNAIAPLMVKKIDGTITGAEEDRLQKLIQLQTDFGELQQRRQDEIFKRAYDAALTHAATLENIEREYQENVKALGEGASTEQLAQLKRDRDEKVSAETSANLKIEESWESMFSVMDNLGAKAIRVYLQNVQKRIDAEFKAGKITAQEYEKLNKEILDGREKLAAKSPFTSLIDAVKRYRNAVSDSNKTDAEKATIFKEIAASASMAFSDVNQVLGSVTDGMETLGIGSEGLRETLGKVQNVIGGLSELSEGIATKNPVTIITGSIKALSSVIELFNTRDKKLQKQIEGYQRALKALEQQFDQLQRKIENSVGNSYYEDSLLAVKNLHAQIKQLEAARDAESKKKKADAEKIQGYNDAIISANNAIEDLQQTVSESLLQTNYKELSQNIADALVSAFEAGENAVDAMDKTFDQFIKNALVNSLKLKILEPRIKALTDELTKYMLENDQSLIGFDFNTWREELDGLSKQFVNGLEQAYDGLGLEKDPSSGSSMSGQIGRAITEDTANKLMGVQLNLYTLAKTHVAEAQVQSRLMQSHVNISQQNLNAVLSIERNTAGTWNEMKNAVGHLVTIANNTKPQYDIARNKGIG